MFERYEKSLESVRKQMIYNFTLVLVGIAAVLFSVIAGFYFLEKSEINDELAIKYIEKFQEEYDFNDELPGVVSRVTTEISQQQNKVLRDNLSILFATLFILSSVPAFFISQSMARKTLYAIKRKHYAYFDEITELPSCNMLIDRLNHIFAQSRRYNHKFSILYMNIDHFSDINASWGKEVGDRTLKVIAERLVSTVRNSDTVSYMGDDEFAIILSVVNGKEDASIVAEKIVEKMKQPFKHHDEVKYLGVSIGISTYPDDGSDTETLMNKADRAMVKVKNSTKNSFLHAE